MILTAFRPNVLQWQPSRYASVYSCMIQVESVPATLVPRKQVVLVTALLGLNQVL